MTSMRYLLCCIPYACYYSQPQSKNRPLDTTSVVSPHTLAYTHIPSHTYVAYIVLNMGSDQGLSWCNSPLHPALRLLQLQTILAGPDLIYSVHFKIKCHKISL